MIKRKLFGAAALSIVILLSGPSAANDGSRLQIRHDFIQVLASGEALLAAQSDFNAAKAAGDRISMEHAAFDMLMASAAAAFWTAMLDDVVTERNTTDEIDRKVSELRALAGGVLQGLAPIVVTGNLEGLSTRLDESAETITRFNRLTRGVSALPGLRDLI